MVVQDLETQEHLAGHRRVWDEKPVLRRIYREEFFSRLVASCRPGGRTVEIGAGPGFLKELVPGLISTDIAHCPWLDLVADAHALPFRDASVTNVVGLDVLHHFEDPVRFLAAIERVLVPGGRLILVEPWVTPFSYLIYRYFHQEDCDLNVRLWERTGHATNGKRPFDGNQAIPYLLFGAKTVAKTLAAVPRLTVVRAETFCLFAYLLSFGFKKTNLLPVSLYDAVAAVERRTLPLWRSVAALRVHLVLEKQAP